MHDPFAPSRSISLDDAQMLLGTAPLSVGKAELVVDTGPLSSEELLQGRDAPSHFGGAVSIAKIRYSHHKLAQCLAAGISVTATAALCNYDAARIYTLMGSPAFKELIAHYRDAEQRELIEFADAAKNLSLDMLHLLQEKMDEHPERFSPSMLGELIKTLADRSGNAPLTRTQNINVNLDMGTKLRDARMRAMEAERGNLLEGQARLVSP